MIDDVIQDVEGKMRKSIDALKRELITVRTGRAHPSLVERLPVEYYGTPTPLNQLASITTPEVRMLVIQPYDRGAINAIEKAIQKSELGLNPNNDGQVIRLIIPPLTEDRRREMVKLVRRKVEEGRVALRNVRREGQDDLKDLEKEKLISSDELHRGQERLQKLTDRYVAEIDQLGQHKEAEVLEV